MDLINEQHQLETEGRAMGEQRYYDNLQKHVDHGNEDMTAPVRQAIQRVVAQVTDGVREILSSVDDRRGRKGGQIKKWALAIHELHASGLDAQSIAYIALRHGLSHISTDQTLSRVSSRIGRALLDEKLMRQWKDQDPDGYKITQEQIKKYQHRKKSAGVVRRMQKLADLEVNEWPYKMQVRVGMALCNVLIETTGWFKSAHRKTSRLKSVRTWEPTIELSDWLEQGHARMAALSPVLMPMVVEPDPWTSPWDGGYLTISHSLVKTRNKDYLRSLEDREMPLVYDALNALQSTAWRVNESVLAVAQEMWQKRHSVGQRGDESLPPRDPAQVPAIPAQWEGKVPEWKETDYDGYKAWAQRAAAVHEENQRNASKRISTAETIGTADRFSRYDEIYFPHQLDFRGRAYPLPVHLNPQGADLARGLLTFAEAKEIGEDGAYWLKVHAANCAGVDKVPFDERVQWIEDRRDEIMLQAMEPVDGDQWWTEADEPFQFLAACFELAGYWLEGPTHKSSLPVSLDGSCNGLQNFSALLRDPVGGKATNLVPADRPADIYTEVAEVVAQQVTQDGESGESLALPFEGLVSRSLVKQPVMTLPYGATKMGMRRMIENAVRKMGNPSGIRLKDMWKHCGYAAGVTYDGIGQVVIAAREAMDWLRDAAKIAAKQDTPITWVTPLGFPVLQDYRKVTTSQVNCHVAGKPVTLMAVEETEELNRRRQASGISPNYIHSLDAAHMMRTALYCWHEGVHSLSMVHDSFGTHAADVPVLNAAIRQAFVDQYEDDLMTQFRDELVGQLKPDTELPDLPAMGELDITCVLESDYFFS